jgi:hypothetical protein
MFKKIIWVPEDQYSRQLKKVIKYRPLQFVKKLFKKLIKRGKQ